MRFLDNFLYIVLMIDGIYSEVSIQEQLEHVLTRRLMEAERPYQNRRYSFQLDRNNGAEIIGAPSLPSHLPEAEPILPGHTLIRPALGMLKSSIKFPHKELENGAGVYGNYNNLGIKYDGRNERVLYTGFRRNADPSLKNTRRTLSDYIMVVPSVKTSKPSFSITNLALDLEEEKQANRELMDRLKFMRRPLKNKRLIVYIADPTGSPLRLTDLYKEKNTVIYE